MLESLIVFRVDFLELKRNPLWRAVLMMTQINIYKLLRFLTLLQLMISIEPGKIMNNKYQIFLRMELYGYNHLTI